MHQRLIDHRESFRCCQWMVRNESDIMARKKQKILVFRRINIMYIKNDSIASNPLFYYGIRRINTRSWCWLKACKEGTLDTPDTNL